MLLHHAQLDCELADGASPDLSPEHAVRARQLQSTHKRHELAAQIDTILHRVDHPPHWHSPALPIRADEVQAARAELQRLRRALLEGHELGVPGLALASLLLHGEDSPIYTWTDATSVATDARAALTAMTTTSRGR